METKARLPRVLAPLFLWGTRTLSRSTRRTRARPRPRGCAPLEPLTRKTRSGSTRARASSGCRGKCGAYPKEVSWAPSDDHSQHHLHPRCNSGRRAPSCTRTPGPRLETAESYGLVAATALLLQMDINHWLSIMHTNLGSLRRRS